uniref:Uncharacterized protein n=1 Tax=Anguilla anguilla TaxID=7936 RepID=A0A0E9UZU3_ANGAN
MKPRGRFFHSWRSEESNPEQKTKPADFRCGV